MDETWIHHYLAETEEQSKKWTFPGELPPKKAKTVPLAGKVMAISFWDSIEFDEVLKEKQSRLQRKRRPTKSKKDYDQGCGRNSIRRFKRI